MAPEVAAAADVAADERTAGALVVGRGALLYADALGRRRPDVAAASRPVARTVDLEALGLLDPDPAELARLALDRVAAGQVLGTEPLYLRRPDAVPQAARKRVLG